MTDETNTNVDTMEQDYIQTIQELKANTVPVDRYNKLKEENSKLLKSLVNGETLESSEVPTTPSVQELQDKLFHSELNNLEYCDTALKLRKALMDNGEADPFVPSGSKYVPDDNDYATAQRVADQLQRCIDYADGDSAVFTNELQRITIDTAPTRAKK